MKKKIFISTIVLFSFSLNLFGQNNSKTLKCEFYNETHKMNIHHEMELRWGLWEVFWDNGQLKEKGEYSHKNKNISCDNMYANNKIGVWEYYYENGQLEKKGKYDGEGDEIGDWEYYYENGKLEKKGKYNGDGYSHEIDVWEYYYENGQLEKKGKYDEDGDEIGDWEYYYENGKLEKKGKYDEYNKKIGVWEYYYENGQLKEKREIDGDTRFVTNYYENGKLEKKGKYDEYNQEIGVWEYYYENGQLKEKGGYYIGEFNKSRAGGIWTHFYNDGSFKEERYYNNSKLDGEVKYYFKGNNKIQRIDLFKNGIFIGPKEVYDENGNQIFKDGSGLYRLYFENGQLYSEINYKNGCRDGIAIWYYPNGQMKQKAIYKYDENSKPTGLRWEIISIFDVNGNPLEKGNLANGNGSWIQYDDTGKKTGIAYYENGKPK